MILVVFVCMICSKYKEQCIIKVPKLHLPAHGYVVSFHWYSKFQTTACCGSMLNKVCLTARLNGHLIDDEEYAYVPFNEISTIVEQL